MMKLLIQWSNPEQVSQHLACLSIDDEITDSLNLFESSSVVDTCLLWGNFRSLLKKVVPQQLAYTW